MADNYMVNRVGGARQPGEAQDAAALTPGALTGYDDHEWSFTGNGTTTPTEVMLRVIEIERDREPFLGGFVGSRDAAQLAAQQNLLRANPHLSRNPNEAVPENQQFVADTTNLKALLAPFANNLEALRHAVAAAEASAATPESAAARTVGNVASLGLRLPTDPRI